VASALKRTGHSSQERRLAQKRAYVQAYFAHNFNQRAAAISVGVAPKSAAQVASNWMRQDDVVGLLNEEWEKLRVKHEMSLDVAIEQLKRIGVSSIAHFLKRDELTGKPELDDKGMPIIDFTQTTLKEYSGIAELTVTERVLDVKQGEDGSTRTVTARKTHLKMMDRIAALDKLVRILGGYEGKEPPTFNDNRTQIVADQVTVTTQESAADEYRRMINGG
jgi:phage terminase small subunit